MRRIFVTIVSVIVSLAFLAEVSLGAEFCVSTTTELQNALSTAATNGEDDVIKVIQGTYTGNFTYYSSEGLTLLGGYTAGCVSRVIDPSNTVLDASGSGRVLSIDTSSSGDILIEGFTIKNGNAIDDGGGLFFYSAGDHGSPGNITLSNNIITGNTGLNGGGAFLLTGGINRAGKIILNNNIITGNTSYGKGGGVYAESSRAISPGEVGGVTFINNIIAGNVSYGDGGGLFARSGSYTSSVRTGDVTLINNSITGNNSNQNGGGAYLKLGPRSSASINVYNNIIWNNTASIGRDIYTWHIMGSGTSNGYNNDYSDEFGGWDNAGNNIDADPLFVGGGDYHLQSTSPCIDTGINTAPELPVYDFEGDPRIIDGDNDGIQTADMGADEFIRIIYPPLNFTGKKVMNRSLFLVEYINNLSWQANPDNENILKYRIYQVEGGSQSLLVELDANTFGYWHRGVEKNKQYTYALVAVNDEGREGDPTTITVQ